MALSTRSFKAVTDMFHEVSGIRLSETKRSLVEGRLQKLAQDRGYGDQIDRYVNDVLLQQDAKELVRIVDKLTTNETYFFREPDHFKFLTQQLRENTPHDLFRVWSAASSSGEEAHSIAMVLHDVLGDQGWEIIGTDLSTAMIQHARRGLYPLDRARETPQTYLKRYCLKGQKEYEGQLLIAKELRQKIQFKSANLTENLPHDLGLFDVIFLRNVLIYFDNPGKTDIVLRVLHQLKPDGYLLCGHAESLSNLNLPLRAVRPAVYVHA